MQLGLKMGMRGSFEEILDIYSGGYLAAHGIDLEDPDGPFIKSQGHWRRLVDYDNAKLTFLGNDEWSVHYEART